LSAVVGGLEELVSVVLELVEAPVDDVALMLVASEAIEGAGGGGFTQ